MKTWFLCLALLISHDLLAQQNFRMRAHKVQQLNNPEYSANDVKAEIEFGRGLASRILKKYPLVNDPQLQQYVNTIGSGLAAQIGRPELSFYFGVIDTMDVNAYACPGGYVLLTKGVIKMLSNEAELAGVLAHEITHVNERHVIKKLKIKGKDDSVISGLGALVGGATASFRVAIKTLSDEAMNVLFNDGLQKSEELDSDQQALLSLQATGYSIDAYRSLLLKIRDSMAGNKARVLEKTHPKVDDRLELVSKFEKNNPSDSTLKNKERFEQYAKF